MSGPYPDNGRDAYADMSQHYSSARARALRDGITLLSRLVEPCDDGTSDHAWGKCRRCLTLHEIQNHREPAMRLLRVVLAQFGAQEQRDELLAVLCQVRDFYMNADSAWRFSEAFPIDVVCRAIGKAEGLPEPYPPFQGTDVMDGDEDRP